MGNIAVYSHQDGIPTTSVGGSGGGMDNTLARIGALEVAVSDIRNQVTVISATVPSLATKAELTAVHSSLKEDMASVKEDIASVKATIPHLATKDDLATLRTEFTTGQSTLKEHISSLRTEFTTGQSTLKEDISSLKATIPHLATKADFGVLETKIEAMGTRIAASEAKLIQWIVGTGISSTALAISLIKLIH